MAIPVIVYGKSGAGKSFSMKNFPRDKLLLCNCLGKPLPFRGGFDLSFKTLNIGTILRGIERASQERNVKSIAIDDAGYIMTSLFMNGHRDKKGGNQYDLYNDIGDAYWAMLNQILAMPDDVIVYIMMHESVNDFGDAKIRTIGKLLEDKVCIEGMCTVVLHALTEQERHFFRVRSAGNDIAKSPEGMFASAEIDNDLFAVDSAIRAYYGQEETKNEQAQ